MNNLYFEDNLELACAMLDRYDIDNIVTCIGYYETISELIKHIILVSDGAINVHGISLEPYEYDDLYCFQLDEDGIYCYQLKDQKIGKYLHYAGDYVFVDSVCGNEILDHYGDGGEISYFSIDTCDGDCDRCSCSFPNIEKYDDGTFGFEVTSKTKNGYQTYIYHSSDFDEVVAVRDEVLE